MFPFLTIISIVEGPFDSKFLSYLKKNSGQLILYLPEWKLLFKNILIISF